MQRAGPQELRPGAVGFLGSTGRVTPAGEVLVLARFASPAAAAENAARPEQDAWWQELVAALGDVVRDMEYHGLREPWIL